MAIEGTHELDLNMDGSVDFWLDYQTYPGYYGDDVDAHLHLLVNDDNAFITDATNPNFLDSGPAAALESGVEIGPNDIFKSSRGIMTIYAAADSFHPPRCGGSWSDVKNRFLGLRFTINDEVHFAWVRLDVSWKSKAVLKDWAYESNPGAALITGANIPTPSNPTTWGQIKARYGN